MIFLASCSSCGALTRLPNYLAAKYLRQHDAEEDPTARHDGDQLLISRCAIVRELDSGPNECSGNVYIIGAVALTSVDDCLQFLSEIR